MNDRLVRCPTCSRMVPLKGNPNLPFCSPRCANVDLGKWLDEQYTVDEPGEDSADAPSPDGTFDRED